MMGGIEGVRGPDNVAGRGRKGVVLLRLQHALQMA